jgi:hypothetical protein
MPHPASSPVNVVRFKDARAIASPQRDQKSLLDAVYACGSLAVPAEDRATKQMAARLQIYGFVTLDEVQPDGSARRLRPSEAVEASSARPWRVSKPSFAASLAAWAS